MWLRARHGSFQDASASRTANRKGRVRTMKDIKAFIRLQMLDPVVDAPGSSMTADPPRRDGSVYP